jgi:hypothetical protein
LTPSIALGFVMIGAPFVASLGMLALQTRALLQHRNFSFLLLSLGTISGILGLAFSVVPFWWDPFDASPATLQRASAAFLLTQCVLGLWGTASLFESYRLLASVVGVSPAAAEAPNQRLERP